MKKALQLFFPLAILSLASVSVSAQRPGGDGPGGRMGGMNMDPEQRAERQATQMHDTLQLSDDMTAEVKAVLLVYAKKMQEARTQANGDWEAMRGTMQTLRKEQDEELAAMIGEEQWAKWETIRAGMMQRGPRGEGAPGQEQGGKKRKKKDTKTDN